MQSLHKGSILWIMTPSDPHRQWRIQPEQKPHHFCEHKHKKATGYLFCDHSLAAREQREKDGQRGTWTRGQTDRRGRETDRVFSSLFSLVAALRNTSVQNVYALHFWWCHKRCHGFSKVFSFRWTQQNLPVRATVS